VARPQFEIRSLLILTAVFACGLTFATQTGGWLIALLVTILLANVLAVIIALVVYLLLPLLENKSTSRDHRDAE
jgi:hypothetical protein